MFKNLIILASAFMLNNSSLLAVTVTIPVEMERGEPHSTAYRLPNVMYDGGIVVATGEATGTSFALNLDESLMNQNSKLYVAVYTGPKDSEGNTPAFTTDPYPISYYENGHKLVSLKIQDPQQALGSGTVIPTYYDTSLAQTEEKKETTHKK